MLELEESQLSLCDKEFIEKDYEGKEAGAEGFSSPCHGAYCVLQR